MQNEYEYEYEGAGLTAYLVLPHHSWELAQQIRDKAQYLDLRISEICCERLHLAVL